jgi:D-amino peptidase
MPLAILLLLLAACSPSSSAPPAAQGPTTPPREPWTLEAVTPDTADGIRILVLHDMEGLSGQSDPRTFDFGTPQYPTGQQLLAADLNAVIAGLFAGGATGVEVVDGHGSGNPEPDARRDLLDTRAGQVLQDEAFDAYFDLATPKAYDAVAVVGMHAKTGSRGFASHTLTLGMGVIINGRAITETELMGLSWGRIGVPIIFASGDDRLAADLTGMTWLQMVTVKTAVGADSAVLRPVAEARAELTAAAKRAVESFKAGRTRSMRVTSPITAGLRAVPPASLAMLEGIPGIAYADSTLTFPADSLRHAYDVIEKLVGAATGGYVSVLRQSLRASKAGPEIMNGFRQSLERAWFDYESGRWTKPAPPPAGPARRHHGYQ